LSLAWGDWEGDVVLWDLAKGTETRRLRAHLHPIASLSFTSDGQTLATGAKYSAVRLWDPRTGKERPGLGLLADVAWMGSFSPDGKTLAVWGGDYAVHFWDVLAGKEKQIPPGHGSSVFTAAVSPDSRTVASAARDGVRLWEAATGRQIQWLRGHAQESVRCVAFTPDGKVLASGGGDGTVHLWDTGTGKVISQLKSAEATVFCVAFSPDGRLLYSVGSSLVQVWDRATGKAMLQFGLMPAPDPPAIGLGGGLPEPPTLAVSPDGRTLATLASWKLQLWRALTGKEMGMAGNFRNAGAPLAFSPDGRVLASMRHDGVTDGIICLWEVATGKERLRMRKAKLSYESFWFSSDWRSLVVRCDDGSVRLLCTATGEEARVFPRLESGLKGVVYAPNGRFLVTRSHDTTMLVWDVSEALNKAPPFPELPRGRKGLWQKPAAATHR
jgi:WD40 repeat protein